MSVYDPKRTSVGEDNTFGRRVQIDTDFREGDTVERSAVIGSHRAPGRAQGVPL